MIGGMTTWEIMWTIGLPHRSGLPHLPGVPHLHVDLYPSWTKLKRGENAWRVSVNYVINFVHIIRLIWTSASESTPFRSRYSRLSQALWTSGPMQFQLAVSNWFRFRSAREHNSLNLIRLVWSVESERRTGPKGLFTWRWGTPDRWSDMRRVTPPIM